MNDIARNTKNPRSEDHLKRAAERLKEFRGAYGETSQNDSDWADAFSAPPAPPGWTYEWKRYALVNKEDNDHQLKLARQGWTPVPAARHPEMMPRGWKGDDITRDGMLLMERPQVLTDEARAKERRDANLNVRAKEQQLGLAPKGQFDRMKRSTGVSKSFEGVPIPEE